MTAPARTLDEAWKQIDTLTRSLNEANRTITKMQARM